jgi:DNA-binding NtrC family response regulator/tetratricopeptide (TPR) repeat protein
MLPGPPELENWYRRFLEGRGDAIAPLLCYMRSGREARAHSGAWAALIVSRIYLLKGNLRLSQTYLRLASTLSAPIGSGTLRLGLLVNRALVLKARGETSEAAKLLRAIVDRALRSSDVLIAAKAASNLALCLARCGAAESASSYLGIAGRYYSATGCVSGLIRTGMIRALVDMKRGAHDEAIDQLWAALDRCREGRYERERAVGLMLLAELFIGGGNLGEAREALDKAAAMEPTLARFGLVRLKWLHLESAFNRLSGNIAESRRFSGMAEAARVRLGVSAAYDALDHSEPHASSIARQGVPRVAAASRRGGTSGSRGDAFITCDRRMTELLGEIRRAASLSLPILIEGESGTGKELIARLVHQWSAREREPFVPVNVAALPVDLFESMAFGHARGAFTGAVADRAGLFAAAGRGTIFLDEIGELQPAIQAKLLRLIDRSEYIPLGETKPRRFEARIVAATNRDLKADCASGRLRLDLYHRLAPLVFRIPPLRERREDIVCLAHHFAERMPAHRGQGPLKLHESALRALSCHAWPGNVRELESEILRASLKARGDVIRACHLSPALILRSGEAVTAAADGLRAKIVSFEKTEILEALHASGGNRSMAARRLGLKRTTLLSAMRRLGIDW